MALLMVVTVLVRKNWLDRLNKLEWQLLSLRGALTIAVELRLRRQE
jgi:hypothetical protein